MKLRGLGIFVLVGPDLSLFRSSPVGYGTVLQDDQDLCGLWESSRGEEVSRLDRGTGMGPFRRVGNWNRGPWPCRRAGLRGPTGLRLLQKWILDSKGLGVRMRPEGVCAVKKAGVRDPEGSAGLLRAIEPMSLAVRSREGADISRPLGFLVFGGTLLAKPLFSGVGVAWPRSL